jgi:hypothetical protein
MIHGKASILWRTLICIIMIVLLYCKTKTIFIQNAENKDQTGAFWVRNLNLSAFIEKTKDYHYANESTADLQTRDEMCA